MNECGRKISDDAVSNQFHAVNFIVGQSACGRGLLRASALT
jgi:hypothetical protein